MRSYLIRIFLNETNLASTGQVLLAGAMGKSNEDYLKLHLVEVALLIATAIATKSASDAI